MWVDVTAVETYFQGSKFERPDSRAEIVKREGF